MPSGRWLAASGSSHEPLLREVVSIHGIGICADRVLYSVGHGRAGVYSAGERVVGQFPIGLEVSVALDSWRGRSTCIGEPAAMIQERLDGHRAVRAYFCCPLEGNDRRCAWKDSQC